MLKSPALRVSLAIAFAFVCTAEGAHAQTPDGDAPPVAPPPKKLDYDTPRYEPAGFPIIGGSSDIGVEMGAVATLTKFADGIRPYYWNMDFVFDISVKEGPEHAEVVQQNYLWQLDMPGLFDGRVRINPALSYTHTINVGYFGLGNDSSPNRPADATGDPGRYFESINSEVRLRELTRITIEKPWDLMVATIYRYDNPSAYAGSKLATDAAGGAVIHGLEKLSLVELGTGAIYDTRDNEYFPRRGAYHQMGVKYVQGFPTGDVDYGEAGAVFAEYLPVSGPFVFAARAVTDFQFGHVPYYDLFTGGPFLRQEMPGGSSGVRGVPIGRYLGKIKAIANIELRAMLVDFTLLKQEFHFGGNLLADAGRIWEDYTFRSPRDGSLPGIKWGAGGGLYLQWGQAAIFRLEVAYSPDAVAENPKFPVGLYVSDGTMFLAKSCELRRGRAACSACPSSPKRTFSSPQNPKRSSRISPI